MSGDGEALGREARVFPGGEPRLLLIDTCGREASVAVSAGEAVVAERRFAGRGAAERLLGEVRAVLGEAACELEALSAIGVVRGPGSFTGVRVGLAMAKGLAEGAGLGLIAMSRLEVLAGDFWARAGESVSVLEAGRGEGFWARFAAGAMVGEGLATAEEVAGMCAGAEVFRDEAEGGTVAMSAGSGVSLALRRLAAGERSDPMLLDALYLRRTEAELFGEAGGASAGGGAGGAVSDGVVVRSARVGDLGAVLAMERAAATAPHWAEAVYAGMLKEGGERERCLLVAEVDGEVKGFGAASVLRVTGVAEVENLVVVDAARRRGVGRAICAELVAWARAAGAGGLELEVRADNAGARALYEGLGFVEVGVRRGYYGGGEDAVLMGLGLER